jgi:hypothetical protein
VQRRKKEIMRKTTAISPQSGVPSQGEADAGDKQE